MSQEENTFPKQNPTNTYSYVAGLIIVLLLLFAFIKFIDWGFFKSEITAYPVQCKHTVELNQCEQPEYTLRKTTYKVSSDRQEVLYWTEDFDTQKLTNCAVRDKKNWSCEYNDKSSKFGFTDGNFWEIVNTSKVLRLTADLTEKTYYTSKLEYLKIQCKDSGVLIIVCFILN